MNKNLEAKKPTAFLRKNVKFDLKPVFKGITKAVTHVATLKLEELGNDAIETLSGLGLETTPEELAFLLLRRSLSSAFVELAQDSINHFQESDKSVDDKLTIQLETKLSHLTISLDKSFLDAPAKQKFLSDILPLYAQWLADMGVNPHSAEIISQRLPSYFVFSLTKEWRKNAQQYKPLVDALQTPFTKAAEREWDWENYYAMLKRRTQENVFDEPFSLAQIYVPLNAYYIEKQQKGASTVKFEQHERRIVVDLSKELISWIKNGKPEDAIRVLSGGPGSGKSSFTKMLCSNMVEMGIARPIYVPLHLIDPTREVADEVARFVRDEGYLRFNPLDIESKEENLLLIFDGLDELANQGKVAAQVAKDFVQAVERMVTRRNFGPLPIKVLISGREVVIQENQSDFRKPKQVLTILPYFVAETERDEYEDKNNLLENDARNDWWKKYGDLTANKFEGLPRNLQRHEIDEITAQPLLNYLVALSFTRGKINFEERLNLNTIYADLVTAVYERGYEKGRTFIPIRHISCNEFIRVLEEIGVAAWHASDGRSTSVNEILDHCRESGLEKLVLSFQEGAQAGVTKLLAAFFFRKSGEHASGDPTFVFTHKSFGEYLTSARIVRAIDRLVTQLERRKENPDDGFDVIEALIHWTKIAGPAQTTLHIRRFLIDEIRQRPLEQVTVWHEQLSILLSYVIGRSMPMEKIGALTFAEATRQNSNASEALVLALNACAVVIQKTIKLEFFDENSFGSFIRRTIPQRIGPKSPILFEGLSYFDFSGQCLDMVDLYGANLAYTVWHRAALHFANFSSANLRNADFRHARMAWSRFANTRLIQVTMEQASLEEADFKHANLNSVDFSEALLKGADFTDARFHEVSFNNAYVERLRILRDALDSAELSTARNPSSVIIEENSAMSEDIEEDEDVEELEELEDEEEQADEEE